MRKILFRLFPHKYYDENHCPTKCVDCGCTEFIQDNICYLNGIVCEYVVKCRDCKSVASYWAYGYYQPIDISSFVDKIKRTSKNMLRKIVCYMK